MFLNARCCAVESLCSQLQKARIQAHKKLDLYKGLCKMNGQERVTEWLSMSTEPVIDAKGEVHSVYRMKEGKGMLD